MQKPQRSKASWEKYVRKYVWDDDRTPYFFRVDQLNKAQANKELFLFVIFVATPFALVAVMSFVAVTRETGGIAYLFVLVYAFTIVMAVFLLNGTKHPLAAMWSATAPLAILLYLITSGFPPKLHAIEQGLLLVFLMLWLRYTVRVIRITRRYPAMAEGDIKPKVKGGPV